MLPTTWSAPPKKMGKRAAVERAFPVDARHRRKVYPGLALGYFLSLS
jgi:hypothetical protein